MDRGPLSTSTSINPHSSYDYIIAGAGCAGLSLAVHLVQSGAFADKKILITEQADKKANDRTWCFWEKEPGLFESIVYKSWDQLAYHDAGFSSDLQIAPYRYKMIRGIDFYRYCFELLGRHPNITIRKGRVEETFSDGRGTGIRIDGETILAGYVFNSILTPKPQLSSNQYWLLQHFRGWMVETGTPSFTPGKATLMDFRMSQHEGTAFCYVLPFTTTKALVEYTLFSPSMLTSEAYDAGLKHYLEKVLGISGYKILETENGVIPMTNYPFSPGKNSLVNIGTAGGQTKGSSGYTFRFIQKHSARIRDGLIQGHLPTKSPDRFSFYDSVLLNILQHNTLPGHKIFTDLFRKNPASLVLKFLDNETSLAEELKIISSLPTLPFFKAAVQQVF